MQAAIASPNATPRAVGARAARARAGSRRRRARRRRPASTTSPRPSDDDADEQHEHRRAAARDRVDDRERHAAGRRSRAARSTRARAARSRRATARRPRCDVPDERRRRGEDELGGDQRDGGRRLDVPRPREQQVPERVENGGVSAKARAVAGMPLTLRSRADGRRPTQSSSTSTARSRTTSRCCARLPGAVRRARHADHRGGVLRAPRGPHRRGDVRALARRMPTRR